MRGRNQEQTARPQKKLVADALGFIAASTKYQEKDRPTPRTALALNSSGSRLLDRLAKTRPDHPVVRAWVAREAVPYHTILQVAIGACLEHGSQADQLAAATALNPHGGVVANPNAPAGSLPTSTTAIAA